MSFSNFPIRNDRPDGFKFDPHAQLRTALWSAFKALEKAGLVAWRSASTLPEGRYEPLALRRENGFDHKALFPVSIETAKEYFIERKAVRGGEKQISGPYPFQSPVFAKLPPSSRGPLQATAAMSPWLKRPDDRRDNGGFFPGVPAPLPKNPWSPSRPVRLPIPLEARNEASTLGLEVGRATTQRGARI